MASTKRANGEGTVFERGDRWWAQITAQVVRADGRVATVRKTKVRPTRRQAYAALRELQAAHSRPVGDEDVTVEAWMGYWLKTVCPRRIAASTQRDYDSISKAWMVPVLGKVKLAKLTPAHVRRLHAAMEDVGRSTATRRKAHAMLARALTVAHQDGLIDRNPARLVDAPRPGAGRHAALTTEQAVTALGKAAPGRESARVHLALLAGLRQGEALGLDWADVDLPGAVIRVHQVAQRIKGEGVAILPRLKRGEGATRDVVLLPEVVAALTTWRAESGGVGLVFGRESDRGKPTCPEADNRAWHDLLARAGLPTVPLHGARASAATRLLDLGVAPHIVAAIIGDLDSTMLRHYARQSIDTQRAALAGLPAIGGQ